MPFPDGWYAAAISHAIRRRPVRLRRFGRELVAWRDAAGRPACVHAACPHRGADLALGRTRDGLLECPYHGFRFAADGRCARAPCQGHSSRVPGRLRAQVVPAQEQYGLVWLWWGSGEPTARVPWFASLKPQDPVATVAGVYACHFTRYMENALDLHHLAFVHRLVLPFVGSVVDMRKTSLDGDAIYAEGRILPGPGERLRWPADFILEARFPGLTRLELLGAELLVAACPQDERSTWVAGRYYRPRFGAGVVARAASWLAAQADYQTAQRQDRRVLRSIRPLVGSPRANTMVSADRPISLWYARLAQSERQELPQPACSARPPAGHATGDTRDRGE